MRRDRRERGVRVAVLALFVLALAMPGAALAAGSGFKLALAPVGQGGPYFDLTMRPGDSVGLEVDIANGGGTGVATRTYAADVFTISNGGYGGRLRDAAQTGTTTWVEYPTAVQFLRPGEHVRRSLTVTVPADTGPGEYITSLVLENDAVVRGDGDVAFDQIVRQAIAVVISVPGDRVPALELGDARHTVVAGRSIVSVAVENSGNVRLKPVIDFELSDSSRTVISRTSFQMDTFYALTDTHVEVVLAAPLLPGSYSVRLSLEDVAHDLLVSDADIPFVVGAAPQAPAVEGAVPGLTDVAQPAGTGPNWLPTWVVILLAGLMVGSITIGLLVLGKAKRRP